MKRKKRQRPIRKKTFGWKAAWNGELLTKSQIATIQREQARMLRHWGFHRAEVERQLKENQRVKVKLRTRFSMTPDHFIIAEFFFPHRNLIVNVDTRAQGNINRATMEQLNERGFEVIEYPHSSVFLSPTDIVQDLLTYLGVWESECSG